VAEYRHKRGVCVFLPPRKGVGYIAVEPE